jgi:hypothetical protein
METLSASGASQVGQYACVLLLAAPRRKSFTADEGRRYTPMHADGERLNDLSGRMIRCAFVVLNALVVGYR